MDTAPIRAYHFTGNTLRDGRPIPQIGETLTHEGEIDICESGLHGSRHPSDALMYSPGPMLHLVEISGDVEEQNDKLVGRERTIIASIDATDLLREFARWCALQVIDLWDAPDVVRQYLETGDESLRSTARDAATAARDAAWSTAWTVARFTADATWAAIDNAWADNEAAWSAAGWAAAAAAWHAAVWTATGVSAASAAARHAQRDKFTEMVDAAFA